MTHDDVWPGAEWELVAPAELGIDAARLDAAVAGARARESAGPRDMAHYLGGILSFQTHPKIIGPLLDGSGPSGVVVHRGHLVAHWGDPSVVEMSFSVTKTYLSVVAGVAFDRGLIPDVDAPVRRTVDIDELRDPWNAEITWAHLLQQTSQWDGTLWGKPWWSDPQGGQARESALTPPGQEFAYNDVRINLLALVSTRRFGRSLEAVLRAEVMDPIGASDSWRWHGYESSTTAVDGREVESVSGGAHWGGGLWMSALDHARLGLLYVRDGRWHDDAVISAAWTAASTTPNATNADYGLLWWLNHRDRIFPGAPTTGFCARGNLGRQLVWVDPARDLVVVSRWSDDVATLLAEVSAAIPISPT